MTGYFITSSLSIPPVTRQNTPLNVNESHYINEHPHIIIYRYANSFYELFIGSATWFLLQILKPMHSKELLHTPIFRAFFPTSWDSSL